MLDGNVNYTIALLWRNSCQSWVNGFRKMPLKGCSPGRPDLRWPRLIRRQRYACEYKGFQERHALPTFGPRRKAGNLHDEICGVSWVKGGEHGG